MIKLQRKNKIVIFNDDKIILVLINITIIGLY